MDIRPPSIGRNVIVIAIDRTEGAGDARVEAILRREETRGAWGHRVVEGSENRERSIDAFDRTSGHPVPISPTVLTPTQLCEVWTQ